MYRPGSCAASGAVSSYSDCECPVESLAYGEDEDVVLEGWSSSRRFSGGYAECLWGAVVASEVLGIAWSNEVPVLPEWGCGVCECEEGSDYVPI